MRNVFTGLDGVPEDVREAAIGDGALERGRLLRVELPLAIPAIVAGIRIATVTTIGLVTVTSVIGQKNLGELMFTNGFQRNFRTPVTVGDHPRRRHGRDVRPAADPGCSGSSRRGPRGASSGRRA